MVMDAVRNRIVKQIIARLAAFPLDYNGDETYANTWEMVSRGSRPFSDSANNLVCVVSGQEDKSYVTNAVICELNVHIELFLRTSAGGDPEEEIVNAAMEIEHCLTYEPAAKQFNKLADNVEVLSNEIEVDTGDNTVSNATISFSILYKHKVGNPGKAPWET